MSRRNVSESFEVEPLPPTWLSHDPESFKVSVDVPAAAVSGVLVLEVSYDEATNEIKIATEEKERA